MLEKFDRWVARGPFTTSDLSIYRVIYALLVLLTLPKVQFLAAYPSSLFDPPPGPFRIFHTLPPLSVLIGFELLLAVSLACLVFGFLTRIASVVVGLTLMTMFGFTYSLGKIDHSILIVVVPLVVVWAGWGAKYSIDSLRKSSRPAAQTASATQWPMRFLALLIGIAFVTAVAPKILTGWLSWGTQATQGHFLTKYLTEGKTGGVESFFAGITTPFFWEPIDWATILLEGGIIFCVLNWRAFRTIIAVASIFHLAVLLMMGIAFNTNVIAYGAFVSFSIFLPRLKALGFRAPSLSSRAWYIVAAVGIPALALASWLLANTASDDLRFGFTSSIVVVGFIVGVLYLVFEVIELFKWRRGRRRITREVTPSVVRT